MNIIQAHNKAHLPLVRLERAGVVAVCARVVPAVLARTPLTPAAASATWRKICGFRETSTSHQRSLTTTVSRTGCAGHVWCWMPSTHRVVVQPCQEAGRIPVRCRRIPVAVAPYHIRLVLVHNVVQLCAPSPYSSPLTTRTGAGLLDDKRVGLEAVRVVGQPVRVKPLEPKRFAPLEFACKTHMLW